MSSVKNLLAMFENKGETKPPERGRSPGAPPAPSSASGTDSPRPLSKIRTSFVAIEKDGRVGLARDHSGGSSVSRRRMSNDTEACSMVPPAEKLLAAEEITTEQNSTSPELTPEPPHGNVPVSVGDVSSTRCFSKNNDSSPASTPVDTKVQVSPPQPRSLSRAPSDGQVAVEPLEKPHGEAVDEPLQSPVEESAKTQMAEEKPKIQEAAELVKKTNGKLAPKLEPRKEKLTEKKALAAAAAPAKQTPALTSVSTAKTNTKAKKSPVAVKAPTEKVPAKSPAPAHDRRPAVTSLKTTGTAHRDRDHEKGRGGAAVSAHAEMVAHATTPRASKVAHQPARPTVVGGPSSARKAAPAPITTSPPATGFVKPKPKSPTKPVRLPASLMAPTASSAHKTGTGVRQTYSRTGHHAPFATAAAAAIGNTRSPSRTSIGPPSAHANAVRPLRRQSSSITRQRPSIGPPPKQVAKDHPPTRKEKEVDESFIARMMRPTQASASKVHDKVQLPVTPPKRPHPTKSLSDQGAVSMKKLTPAKKSPAPIESLPRAEQPSKTPAAVQAANPPSPSKTPPVVKEEDEQPTSSRTDQMEDDTQAETAGSPAKTQNGAPLAETVVNKPIPQLVETLPTPVEAPKEDEAVVKSEPESHALAQVEASEQEKASVVFSLEKAAKEGPNDAPLQAENILAEHHDISEADNGAEAKADITASERTQA